MTKIIATLLVLWGTCAAHALEEGQFALGVQGGNVALFGDVGDYGSNGLGIGVYGGYHLSDEMFFNVAIIQSSHEDASHRDISLGLDFYVNSYNEAYLFVSSGVSFLHNSIDNPDISGDAFGLFFGGGVDFAINNHMTAGLAARYQFAFDSETTATVGGTTATYKTVQDSMTVMVRLAYLFGGSET